ncbi:MAG: hypothetical protein QNJ70_02675 [Xenococcaceae cyanobacterium MO_207.B15]|nr:hypothetical protein [Xenococcaceae cyanobacterium MO_207.B15]
MIVRCCQKQNFHIGAIDRLDLSTKSRQLIENIRFSEPSRLVIVIRLENYKNFSRHLAV